MYRGNNINRLYPICQFGVSLHSQLPQPQYRINRIRNSRHSYISYSQWYLLFLWKIEIDSFYQYYQIVSGITSQLLVNLTVYKIFTYTTWTIFKRNQLIFLIYIHLFYAVYLLLFKNNKTLFLGHRLYDVDLYLFY